MLYLRESELSISTKQNDENNYEEAKILFDVTAIHADSEGHFYLDCSIYHSAKKDMHTHFSIKLLCDPKRHVLTNKDLKGSVGPSSSFNNISVPNI